MADNFGRQDLTDLISKSWNTTADQRPTFSEIVESLEQLIGRYKDKHKSDPMQSKLSYRPEL